MAQYKHDRFFKFYLRSLYQSKGETIQNIQVRNDEDLEIDFMFIAQSDKFGWQQEDLGLFDALMKVHPTIIIEHYSSYAQEKHINYTLSIQIIDRIENECVKSHNNRAQAIYRAAGFMIEGTLRECLKSGKEYESLIIMSMLQREYKQSYLN